MVAVSLKKKKKRKKEIAILLFHKNAKGTGIDSRVKNRVRENLGVKDATKQL